MSHFSLKIMVVCSQYSKYKLNYNFPQYSIQDKALAQLAIEDKKRQYAAAEKYLEEVLHSALTTPEL